MDNLIIKRIWQDEDIFEIRITAESQQVQAYTDSYTTEHNILELSEKLITYSGLPDDDFIWENGAKGDASTPYTSLRFTAKDQCGHIQIEVYLEIDDGAPLSRHHCCYFIAAEPGLLNQFGQSLKQINRPVVGTEIALNPKA